MIILKKNFGTGMLPGEVYVPEDNGRNYLTDKKEKYHGRYIY